MSLKTATLIALIGQFALVCWQVCSNFFGVHIDILRSISIDELIGSASSITLAIFLAVLYTKQKN